MSTLENQIAAIESTLLLPLPNAAVLEAVKGLDRYTGDMWAAAMTCAYGGIGIHASRTDPATGFPLPETLEAFPAIVRDMERARDTVRNMCDYLRATGPRLTYAEQVAALR